MEVARILGAPNTKSNPLRNHSLQILQMEVHLANVSATLQDIIYTGTF